MRNLAYLFVVVLMVSCSSISSNKSDKEAVEKVLNTFITAVENKEFSDIEQLIGDDFVIYENGLIWDYNEFAVQLEEYDSVGINYEISNMHLIVDASTAHAQFRNTGIFEYPDTTISLNFIESATFVKENNEWRIMFYHSTHLK